MTTSYLILVAALLAALIWLGYKLWHAAVIVYYCFFAKDVDSE